MLVDYHSFSAMASTSTLVDHHQKEQSLVLDHFQVMLCAINASRNMEVVKAYISILKATLLEHVNHTQIARRFGKHIAIN
jgi:hypothetical protein